MDSLDALVISLQQLENVWLRGGPPSVPREVAAPERERLLSILEAIVNAQAFAMAMANGDLSTSLETKGVVAGSLKSLQASLRHLTWQTRMIAAGDFKQKVDFMGEFAEAFNSMVRALEEARKTVEQRESELSRSNAQLRLEVAERQRAEDQLYVINQKLVTRVEEVEALQAQLREQAIRDPLTQAFNRRYLEETLNREIARLAREKKPLSLLMCDLDFFKRVNDTFGHQGGDAMLKAFADLLTTRTRCSDIVCRYGGEEFVVVLPGQPVEVAVCRAEVLRESFAAQRVVFDAKILNATVSIGVATFPLHGLAKEELLHAADQALYDAKASGRNCYRIARPAAQEQKDRMV